VRLVQDRNGRVEPLLPTLVLGRLRDDEPEDDER
jgi:hypothetical protein